MRQAIHTSGCGDVEERPAWWINRRRPSHSVSGIRERKFAFELKIYTVSWMEATECGVWRWMFFRHSFTPKLIAKAGCFGQPPPLNVNSTVDATPICVLISSPQNEDIDIALDNCTGVAFAEMVNAYLRSQGRDEGKVGVIEVRQTKRTAHFKILCREECLFSASRYLQHYIV